MQRFQVKESAPLLEFLFKILTGFNKTTVRNLLKFRAVSVNGKFISQFNHPLVPGDVVQITSDRKAAVRADIKSELGIIYEDEDVIVINKPSGLLTVSSEKVKTETAFYKLYDYLKLKQTEAQKRGRLQPLFIVHRLDKDASGLIVFAKNIEAKEWLQDQWHTFEKKYYAVVYGVPGKTQGTVESYLAENQTLKVYSSPKPSAHGKLSVTHFKVLNSNRKFALVEVDLETGRKHQIRVHLSDIGHPIVGDDKYGGDFKKEKPPIKRLALHAFSLLFIHPRTRKKLTFESDLPEEMNIIERKTK